MIAQASDSGSTAAALLLPLILFALVIVAVWKILSKAGYAGPLALLAVVPLVNVVLFLVFAFSEWPIQRELRELRSAGPRSSEPDQGTPPVVPPPPQF
jgi:hypothetical protein